MSVSPITGPGDVAAGPMVLLRPAQGAPNREAFLPRALGKMTEPPEDEEHDEATAQEPDTPDIEVEDHAIRSPRLSS